MRGPLLALIASLFLAACSTTDVGLSYMPGSGAARSASGGSVAVGAFVDGRGEPATWIGAIRGGFGNPIKKIESKQPVATLVRSAFIQGLEARGVSTDSASARFQLMGTVLQLNCNQYVRREANVEIELVVTERASGRQRLVKTYEAANVEGSPVSLKTGVFGSVEELNALTEKTLTEAVDRALDDAQLRAALDL